MPHRGDSYASKSSGAHGVDPRRPPAGLRSRVGGGGAEPGGSARDGARAPGGPNTSPLTVGTVREAGQSYEVEVVTPGGSLVDRLPVEQASGRIRSLHGRMLASFAPDGGGGMGMMGGGPMGDGLP